MKTKLKSVNGRLTTLLAHTGILNDLILSPLLSRSQEYILIKSSLIEIIKDARKNDYDWIFSKSDIDIDEDGIYTMGSVELIHFFSETGNHHDLEKIFDKNGIGQGIIWDVESSAWYPKFKTKAHAEKFIIDLNDLFDKTFLKKKTDE